MEVPRELVVGKGFVGQLLERALGADARSLPVPDFRALGVELKTVPVDARGRPRESTFVCSAGLDEIARERWETSRVKHKLSCVLLVPIEAEPHVSLEQRRVGTPLLWTPDDEEESRIRGDWEDLADLIAQGLVDAVSARRGHVLQLRPKASSSRVRREVCAPEGERFSTLPRGFYLRRAFMQEVLERRFALPSGT